jgi:hypothetical protein
VINPHLLDKINFNILIEHFTRITEM